MYSITLIHSSSAIRTRFPAETVGIFEMSIPTGFGMGESDGGLPAFFSGLFAGIRFGLGGGRVTFSFSLAPLLGQLSFSSVF